jgi:hypothetical protein
MAEYMIAWPALGTLGVAILIFGFAPGATIRLIALIYPRDNPRRKELIGELYAVPRNERPFWVAEQLEVALFDGLPARLAARRAKKELALKNRVELAENRANEIEFTLASGDPSEIGSISRWRNEATSGNQDMPT